VSGPVALSGALPTDGNNGLHTIVHQLISEPDHTHIVIALVDTVKITERIDDEISIPTVRIRQIEAPVNQSDRDQAHRILEREFQRRTGQQALPLDLDTDKEP
jgi:hypothetical protein